MTAKSKKMIQVSDRNYSLLRNLGNITDTFDTVVTQVLDVALPLLYEKKQRKEDDF
jgi:hypothetical protein